MDEVAVNVTEVEADRGAKQPVRVPAPQTVGEHAAPPGGRHAPVLVAGHDAVGVRLEPAARHGLVHVARQHTEVLVHVGIVGVGVGEAVVLVGGQRELAAGRAAERQPGEGDRRRAMTRRSSAR